jgi:RNA polymerase sigma-70 factor (ECF subfamily)
LEPAGSSTGEASLETSAQLLERARQGDEVAREQLYARHLPVLLRWASGRLPRWNRDLADTADLVQDTLLHSLKHLDGFEHRGNGAFFAYLRQAVLNRIRDEHRKAARRPTVEAIDSGVMLAAPSPLELVLGRDAIERYDAALKRLEPDQKEALIARLEFSLSYAEIATILQRPTPHAARMLVARAVVRLVREMGR